MSRAASALRVPAAPKAPAAEPPTAPRQLRISASQALALPMALALLLAGFGLLPPMQVSPVLVASMFGAGGALALWTGWLLLRHRRDAEPFALEIVLRKQHYLQACAHLSIFAYWGWYWRVVYDSALLIVAQLVFAYAFDMLLSWSRRRRFMLGFGQFPIIFSTNLFLWFKPEWFYFQFAMVAVGFLAKEFLRWQRDGQSSHIFNPSSFPLALASLLLLATGSTGITWGQEIANTFELPPHMRLWIFLIALPGQFLFGVVTMTMSAVTTVVLFGLAHQAIFGTPYFVDAFIPAAVFLGMHLLFTDPSTSPRSELGRLMFGVMYGLAVVALFGLLGRLGMPTFYDKLLAVPLMNLTVQAIDGWVRSGRLRAIDPTRWGAGASPRQRHLVYIGLWAVVFVFMLDPANAYKPRRWLPLWQQACTEDRLNGCTVLGKLQLQYCNQGSGWACNELGILAASGRFAPPEPVTTYFERACALGQPAGCGNRSAAAGGGALGAEGWRRAEPRPAEFRILLQEGQGFVDGLSALELNERACRQGWAEGCRRLAAARFFGEGTPRDVPAALQALEQACRLGALAACTDVGLVLIKGDGVPADREAGRRHLRQACDRGFMPACQHLDGRRPEQPGG